MKSMWIVAFFILIIIIGSYYTMNTLNSESQKLSVLLDKIEQEVNSKNWEKADSNCQSFNNQWSSISKMWCMLIDHYEIDNVNISLAELKSFIETHDDKEALSRLSVLKLMIHHIPDRESFQFKNIF